MDRDRLASLLQDVASGALPPDDALERLAAFPGGRLGYAHVDTHRALRTGHPEVVFGQGKDAAQIAGILRHLRDAGHDGLVTRVDDEKAERVRETLPEVEWHPGARVLRLAVGPPVPAIGRIAVVTAGTSDLPVAQEAAVVAEAFGNRVDRHFDVGVAGIHRLLGVLEELRKARVLVVVAGMEGALASVVAGLVERPVIGVPTSVGYGASFQGLAALLGMLNSCAAGVSVVNIDNGFGAAAQASLINRMGEPDRAS